MELSRPKTKPGPADWFTGEVSMDEVGAAPPPGRVRVLIVSFAPGARTHWHRHPYGQVLYVTEGVGRAQSRGGPVREIRPGDVITFEAGEEHWHGGGPGSSMTHVAVQEADSDGVPTYWDDPVSDEDYSAQPAQPAS